MHGWVSYPPTLFPTPREPMSEEELRIAAAEWGVIAMAAHTQARDVQAAVDYLTAEAAKHQGDEQTIFLAAAELLRDGLLRWDEFSQGILYPKP